MREINEGIKTRMRLNAVVETGVPGFIPRKSEAAKQAAGWSIAC